MVSLPFDIHVDSGGRVIEEKLAFDRARFQSLLDSLERMAGGNPSITSQSLRNATNSMHSRMA